jgi:hypothetical protein
MGFLTDEAFAGLPGWLVITVAAGAVCLVTFCVWLHKFSNRGRESAQDAARRLACHPRDLVRAEIQVAAPYGSGVEAADYDAPLYVPNPLHRQAPVGGDVGLPGV